MRAHKPISYIILISYNFFDIKLIGIIFKLIPQTLGHLLLAEYHDSS